MSSSCNAQAVSEGTCQPTPAAVLAQPGVEGMCASQFGAGGGFPSVEWSSHCTPDAPYVLVCKSNEASVEYCCTNTAKDGACSVCPHSSGCNGTLGGSGAGLCFAQSSECGTNPNPAAGNELIPTCPAMLSTDNAIAQPCQDWCAANPAACNAAMARYCKDPSMVETPACACYAQAAAQPWGHLSYNQLEQVVEANPAVQAQIDEQSAAGGGLAMGCLWPPCLQHAGVLRPQATGKATACPAITNLCLNVVEDVHMADLTTGSITVGECLGDGNKKTTPNLGGGGSNTSTLPFGTQLKLWLDHNPLIIVIVCVVAALILGTLAWLALRGPTPIERAMARMTRAKVEERKNAKEHELIQQLRASSNTRVRARGDAFAAVVRAQLQQQQKALQKRKEALAKDAKLLGSKKVHLSAQDDDARAMQLASVQVQQHGVQQQQAALAARMKGL